MQKVNVNEQLNNVGEFVTQKFNENKKQIKRPFTRLIFSRLGIVSILILLQVGIIVLAFTWMGRYVKYYLEISIITSVIVIICIINSKSSVAYKLSWTILVAGLPLLGTLLYLYTHYNVGGNKTFARLNAVIDETEEYTRTAVPVKDRMKNLDADFNKIADYIELAGKYPAYDNTEVKYYPLGDDVFEDMCEALEGAEHFIFMEYFIVEEGKFWDSILDILKRKVAEGVEVRFMYDDIGSINTLPRHYPQTLREAGIMCRCFGRVKPFFSTRYNNRDHRKVTVVDGKVAFSGGINLADEYINEVIRFGHWKDNSFRLKGDAVKSYTLMFLQMWNANAHPEEKENYGRYLNIESERVPDVAHDGFVIPYADGPNERERVAENAYIDLINNAVNHVCIMTPYFIPDNDMLHAIKHAAKCGIEVSIILPHIPDKKTVNALTKSHYKELLKSGVRLYEYMPGFVHTKLMVSDAEIGITGSVNLDYRSLYLHYECGCIMYKNDAVLAMEADFWSARDMCEEVTLENVKNHSIVYKMLLSILKVFAPLM